MSDTASQSDHFIVREASGACGDLGTFIPHVIGAMTVAGLAPVGVLFGFAAFLIATGLFYGLPLPVQPMKAISAVILTGGLRPGEVAAAGMMIGVALEPDQLSRARERVGAVVAKLDPGIAAQLEASFLGLSDSIRAAVAVELARPSAGIVKPLNPDEMAAARTEPALASLAAFWGQSAPAQLGRVVDAFNRIVAALDTKGRGEFLTMWRGATVRERQLLAWSIAGIG